jgi:hypothetical protein
MSRRLLAVLFCATVLFCLAKSETSGQSPFGTWVNQLNSTAVLAPGNDEGVIVGTYTNFVGQAVGTFPLYGTYDPSSRVLAWSVQWKGYESATAWVGQLSQSGDAISTTWLLVSQQTDGDVWQSTNVGSDVFHQV